MNLVANLPAIYVFGRQNIDHFWSGKNFLRRIEGPIFEIGEGGDTRQPEGVILFFPAMERLRSQINRCPI